MKWSSFAFAVCIIIVVVMFQILVTFLTCNGVLLALCVQVKQRSKVSVCRSWRHTTTHTVISFHFWRRWVSKFPASVLFVSWRFHCVLFFWPQKIFRQQGISLHMLTNTDYTWAQFTRLLCGDMQTGEKIILTYFKLKKMFLESSMNRQACKTLSLMTPQKMGNTNQSSSWCNVIQSNIYLSLRKWKSVFLIVVLGEENLAGIL